MVKSESGLLNETCKSKKASVIKTVLEGRNAGCSSWETKTGMKEGSRLKGSSGS